MTDVLTIDDFSLPMFAAGTQHRLMLRLFDGLTGPVYLPLLLANGRGDGPTLLAVAGVHGDEYEGMEAIRHVFDSLDVTGMRGKFVGIPVANPFAYEARARIAPLHLDGLNLARVFPGDATGSPSQMLAHHLLHLVLRTLTPQDLFIDFHSGSADVPFAPLIGFRDVAGPTRDRAEEAARHFGLPRLWRIPDAVGPFNAETARRGIVTLGTETTGHAGCDPAEVAAFARGLRNLLTYLSILPDDPPPARLTGRPRTTVDVRSPATGFLRPACRLHDEVTAGDRLATIITTLGAPVETILAPISGTIWAARSMPPVRVGELTYMIAERAESG